MIVTLNIIRDRLIREREQAEKNCLEDVRIYKALLDAIDAALDELAHRAVRVPPTELNK